MLVDWFTVGAQAVNFAILAWLLKRFLYKPIFDAIDARENRIAKELADADASKDGARAEREEFRRKNADFEEQRAALLNRATQEAKAEGQRLLDQARQAADALSARRRDALRSDADNLTHAISLGAQREVFAIVRKALSDLASTDLEERLSAVFVRRLREMDAQAKTRFAESLKSASEPALVRSAYDLPAARRIEIQQALEAVLGTQLRLRFETATELICGIELTTDGQKLAWSIAEYLKSMQDRVAGLLEAHIDGTRQSDEHGA